MVIKISARSYSSHIRGRGPIFGSVLALNGFSILVSCVRSARFLQFSLWVSVLVDNQGCFRIFLANAFDGFSGFAKEVTRGSYWGPGGGGGGGSGTVHERQK